jgi:predicted metal-dependent HD superfamily phosphohydrolase
MIEQPFIETIEKYSDDMDLIDTFWNEIYGNYKNTNRFYHTLSHISNMYHQILCVKDEINDYDSTIMAHYYHDIIYDPTKQDNEEVSAKIASERLRSISFPNDKHNQCINIILATKSHSFSEDHDTNLFTDTDLSILGQSSEEYSNYCSQIRKEYSMYSKELYNQGRKKVIIHFLKMDRIFKTDYFYLKFENTARQNMENELIQY